MIPITHKKEWFKYEDIEGDDIVLEIDFTMLKVIAKATTYNFNGEVISRDKFVGWWVANTKPKFFKVLRNNIGNMSEETRKKYLEFINELEEKYKAVE